MMTGAGGDVWLLLKFGHRSALQFGVVGPVIIIYLVTSLLDIIDEMMNGLVEAF